MPHADLFVIVGLISLLLAMSAFVLANRDDDSDPRRSA
jgi:hypothetical protein